MRNLRFAAISLLALAAVYFIGFIWLELNSKSNSLAPGLFGQTLLLTSLITFLSFLIRYARWHRLLGRAGYGVPAMEGLLAYLAGFAFTASPGKAGELVRCRYFYTHGVPVRTTVSAFLYERSMDLLVILGLSSVALWTSGLFVPAAVFVLLVISALLAMARWGYQVEKIGFLQNKAIRLDAYRFVRESVIDCRKWLNPVDLFLSAAMGLVAWSLVCVAFIVFIDSLGVQIAHDLAYSLYPLAMLAGAASMIPGGIGSTEAAIILLLGSVGVSLEQAALAAIGIRVATLWFAMACGLVSVFILEIRGTKTTTIL